jgi:Na+/H+ antiporter NhaD/arsenite permease-like protein
LLEIRLDAEPKDMLLVISTDSLKPLPVALDLVSLGVLGPAQVGCAAVIMIIVFGLIMTEVIHRTMAAMIGATMALYFLALQNRVPSLSTVVGWMDHGTLGLLWGMMLIVGITMRTGVFEWLGVVACRLSGGNKFVLCFLLSFVTGVLSAFLDNVTTILLITPVTIKLCKLVDIDPRPFLVSEAIFSNLMGTATMIGDPPNIIVGNLLSDYLTFTDFLTNLGPGVLIACPFAFFYLTWYYGDGLRGSMNADIANLQKSYPITNKPLLVKCSTVLACVVLSFFLHAGKNALRTAVLRISIHQWME